MFLKQTEIVEFESQFVLLSHSLLLIGELFGVIGMIMGS